MKRILITGGCGFIGSHTSLILIQKGYEIVIIDSNIRSSDQVIQNIYKAMKKISETGKGPESQIPSMGCNIKWLNN